MGRKTRKHTRKHTKKSRKYNDRKMCGEKCSRCGPNCFCGPNCNCAKGCPGNCHMNKKMRGGGGCGCGAYGCPLAPLSWSKMQQQMGGVQGEKLPDQMGGQCVTGCGPILGIAQNGGGEDYFKPPAPIPGPFVGEPTSGFVSQWPSVDGVSGNRNYYDMNMYKSDPQTMMKVGGRRHRKSRRSRKRSQKGGLVSLAPQELVNLGREFGFNYQTAYNSLNGIPAPVNPDPWKGQLQPSTK